MKYTIITGLAGIATAIAIPTPNNNVERILPPNWKFEIASLRGPGCPDFGADPEKERVTRTTYGQNTMDGSEIYYWFVAYPHLRVDLAKTDHSWCETEIAYTEYKDADRTTKGDAFNLRLHKNGTRAIATYDLEEGVKATLEFKYEVKKGDEIVDEISIQGPAQSGKYQKEFSSDSGKTSKLAPLPKCGSGTFKFRTDLYVEGKKGKKGTFDSENNEYGYYGIQQGFSFDWEKCLSIS